MLTHGLAFTMKPKDAHGLAFTTLKPENGCDLALKPKP